MSRPHFPQRLKVTTVRGTDPIPWRDVLRSAVTVPAILVAGLVTVGPDGALFACLSALLVVLSGVRNELVTGGV